MNALFVLRDALVRPFGLKPIGCFAGKNRAASPPHPGHDLDFFVVRDIDDDRLVLTVEDSHLVVMICLHLALREPEGRHLYLTASVQVRNVLGKVYMVPVALVHPLIARWMLRKIEQKHRPPQSS